MNRNAVYEFLKQRLPTVSLLTIGDIANEVSVAEIDPATIWRDVFRLLQDRLKNYPVTESKLHDITTGLLNIH